MPRLLATLLALSLPAAAQAAPAADELANFRADREKSLRADDGWLTVAGLFWLPADKPQRLGTAPDDELALPALSAPPHAATLLLHAGKVTLTPAPKVPFRVNGAPLAAPTRELAPDTTGHPDVVNLGRLSFYIIVREGRHALRLRDPENPARKTFAGLTWFPPDPRLRVVGRFVPDAATLPVPNVLGDVYPMKSPGRVVFRIGDAEMSLTALLETPDATELYFIFADGTTGKTTYPGGRFLYTDLPRDGRVTLDFNRAVSPPCAYTEFATCPLPPAQNRLTPPIEAGETYARPH